MGPTGPLWPKESEMSSRDLSAPGVQKVKTESKKGQRSCAIVDFDTFSTPFLTLRTPGTESSRELISNSFGHFGHEGPK